MKIILLLLTIQSVLATQIVIISDLNGSYGSTEYSNYVTQSVERIKESKPDVVLSTGDMIAGQKHGLNYKAMWSAFHQKVTIPLYKSNIPFLVTPGNHDGSGSIAFKKERNQFINEWNKYKANVHFLDDTHYPEYYAFDIDGILFISLDATLVGKISDAQRLWVEKVLEKNKHYKLKIAFGHIPLIPVAQNRENDYLADKKLENLFSKYNLSAYLSGHHHTYYPGHKDKLYHISQACLGGGARKLIGDTKVSNRSFTRILITNNKLSIEAINPNDGSIIEKASLPESIQTVKGLLIREDLIKK